MLNSLKFQMSININNPDTKEFTNSKIIESLSQSEPK